MIDKQTQSVAEGGTAIQAHGDVAVIQNGLSVAEVQQLTEIFVAQQLPALQEKALQVAKSNIDEFMQAFVRVLASHGGVSVEAFQKPDAQACFTEALRGSASKGHEICLHDLARLVVLRLESDQKPLLTLVTEDAVRILPRITNAHVAYLSLNFLLKYLNFSEHCVIAQAEDVYSRVLPAVEAGFGLSEANRDYLAGLGLINVDLYTDRDLSKEKFRRTIKDCPPDEEFAVLAPSINRLVQESVTRRMALVHSTSVGKLIAIMHIKQHIDLDPELWLS